MIVHLVLFRPRADLPPEQRDGLANAFITALREIPSIQRVRIGARVTLGRHYEQLMRADYPFAAMLEFEDRDGLDAYLQHSAHEPLAARFFDAFEEALMYDYAVVDGEEGVALLTAAP